MDSVKKDLYSLPIGVLVKILCQNYQSESMFDRRRFGRSRNR